MIVVFSFVVVGVKGNFFGFVMNSGFRFCFILVCLGIRVDNGVRSVEFCVRVVVFLYFVCVCACMYVSVVWIFCELWELGIFVFSRIVVLNISIYKVGY